MKRWKFTRILSVKQTFTVDAETSDAALALLEAGGIDEDSEDVEDFEAFKVEGEVEPSDPFEDDGDAWSGGFADNR